MGLYVKMILQSQLIILVNCEKKIYLPSITQNKKQNLKVICLNNVEVHWCWKFFSFKNS